MSPLRTIAMCLVAGALPASMAMAQYKTSTGRVAGRLDAGRVDADADAERALGSRLPASRFRHRPWRPDVRPPADRRASAPAAAGPLAGRGWNRRNATAIRMVDGGASSPARTSRAAPNDAQPASRLLASRGPLPGLAAGHRRSLLRSGRGAQRCLKLEHWTADWRTALLSDRQATTHPGLAIVAITSETLEPYPFMLPIDRGLQAKIVAAVVGAGARAVALDFYFIKGTVKDTDERVPSRPGIAAGQAHPRGLRESAR